MGRSPRHHAPPTWQNQTGQTGCMNASVGHYVDVNGSSSQTPCATGTWQNQTGQTGCMNASAGYYVDTNGSIAQTPCSIGTWQDQTGQASCTNASAGYYVDTNGSTTQTPCGLGTWNNMTGQSACTPASPGLRGHERVDDADALRCGDVQPQLIIQLLHGLPRHPSGELLRARGTGTHDMLHRDLARPVRAGKLHERQCGILRGHERVDDADPLRLGHLEQHDGTVRLHPGIPGILRGHERVDDADALRLGHLEQHDGTVRLHQRQCRALR